MPAASAQKMQPIDLLKIYGNIEYDWNLRTDSIDWQGSLLNLINPDASINTGSSFCNLLNYDNFQRRMQGISDASQHKSLYSITYHMTLPTYEQVRILEEGEVMHGIDHKPLRLEGYIRFIEDLDTAKSPENWSGYDPLTKFPGKEVLYETLAASLTKSFETNIPGAYLTVSIDQLNYLNVVYGYKVLQEIIKQVADKIRSMIRFNDAIGRLSSSCLGVILNECDKWGVLQASQRLTQIVEANPIETSVGPIPVKVSCGGIVFPDEDLTAERVMQQAEKCLFDAQSIKGTGISWTPYGDRIRPDLNRNAQAEDGHKRTSDTDKK